MSFDNISKVFEALLGWTSYESEWKVKENVHYLCRVETLDKSAYGAWLVYTEEVIFLRSLFFGETSATRFVQHFAALQNKMLFSPGYTRRRKQLAPLKHATALIFRLSAVMKASKKIWKRSSGAVKRRRRLRPVVILTKVPPAPPQRRLNGHQMMYTPPIWGHSAVHRALSDNPIRFRCYFFTNI